jgi:hypothetical protein
MGNKVFTGSKNVVYVAGDLHGDHKSFKQIPRLYEKAGEDPLLIFLGDYADRGPDGIEIISELSKLIDTRNDMIALKGNHEIYRNGAPEFFPCDLIHEAYQKCGSWEDFYRDIFVKFLSKLHIAAIINNVLFIHAGIFSGIKSRDDLKKEENEKALLWSDPSPAPGEHKSRRGAGVEFGEDITEEVLSSLGLRLIIRSHEPRKAVLKPCIEHGGKIITINTCSSYGEAWRPFLLKIDTLSLEHEAIYL